MQLTVELVNSRDVEAKIRLVGSRDGRFMDIAFPLGALNKLDHAEFSVSIPAPLAAMTYQFVVHQPDGSLIVRFETSGQLEMCWHLYTWGANVKVIEPIELKELMKKALAHKNFSV